MPENAIIHQQDRFERIATDAAYLAQFLRETRQIVEAAREVLFQRYNTDPNNTFGRDFPVLSSAIFKLGNLVGIPARDRDVSMCQQRRAAS
jgi:hypothetical protein